MLKKIKNLIISGVECLPIVEGGKGIGVSNGTTAGHFAKNGAVGTMSGVNADILDDNGKIIPRVIKAKTRIERHLEMLEWSIKGIVSQAKRARDIAAGKGRIHMNVMWEMGGTEHILDEALIKAKGLIHGITCGAGMPYKLGDIAEKYKVYYYPIVSSMRAFRALWKRGFYKTKEWLGGVVYECPWRAGGHDGFSNSEDINVSQDPYPRIAEIRTFMNEVGLNNVPIIIAGGVWNIEEFEKFLDNDEIGPVAFQFGTRPMLTQESPIPDHWKEALFDLKPGDIVINSFSPTGFYSSAVKNDYLKELFERSERQIAFRDISDIEFNTRIICGKRNTNYFIREDDRSKVEKWIADGFTEAVKTPDDTIIFLTLDKENELKKDCAECIGCISQCKFSCWSQYHPEDGYSSGKVPDFRSMCIQKALQNAKDGTDYAKELLFSGSNGYRFSTDPLYANHHIPTTKELIETIMQGK